MLVVGVLALSACGDGRAPEPVRFALVQPELFADGGALTDAWADFDLDDDPDRFVGFNDGPSRLYRNDLTGGFVDVAADVGLVIERSVRTSAWGDFDADGDPDLLLGFAGDGPVTALYRNDRDAGFVSVAGTMGVELAEGTTRQASWIDFDEDGDLDLFLAMRDRENLLFENRGEEGFVDIASDVGVADPRRTVGAVWFDTGGGRLDLLVGNMDGDPNALYLATSDGFIEALHLSGLRSGGRSIGDETQGTVRPCVVDYDGNGDLDVFFANYGRNGLLVREDDRRWTNVAPLIGLAIDSHFDTCAWGDFDHDGAIDLYVNGTVGGGTHYRDWLMRREGSETFLDVTPPELLELNASHGATWVDYDLDGDLDLALAGAAEDGMHHLVQNLLRPEFAWHSLQVRVLDGDGRATRAGAEVRIYEAGSDRLMGTRIMDTGSGYDSQSDLPVHFGIPGGQPVDVEITIFQRGRRRTIKLEDVDPRDYRGHFLAVRVGPNGASTP
jgi:VCBS repeat protein/ASPIC/UnbV protein